jgi:hypothetical protein
MSAGALTVMAVTTPVFWRLNPCTQTFTAIYEENAAFVSGQGIHIQNDSLLHTKQI